MGSASNNPIPIPGRVRPKQPIRAKDHNQMVDGLRALTQRGIPQPPSFNRPTPRTPFEIIPFYDSGTPKIQVNYGRVDRTTIHDDSAGDEILAFNTVGVTIGLGVLVDDPTAPVAPVGELTLAASTDYGVWLKVPVKKDSWDYYDAPGDETIDATLVEMAETGSATIVTDSTNTDPGDAGAMVASTSGFAYLNIGKVEVDANDVMTITQYRKSDIILPASLYPAHIISTDNSNDNAITKGTDNGVYLAPDAFVVSISGGTDITIDDDGGGAFTINYSG